MSRNAPYGPLPPPGNPKKDLGIQEPLSPTPALLKHP